MHNGLPVMDMCEPVKSRPCDLQMGPVSQNQNSTEHKLEKVPWADLTRVSSQPPCEIYNHLQGNAA